MTRIYAATAVALVLVLLGTMSYFVFRGRDGDQFSECRQSQVATGTSAIGGPFELVDQTGKTVTDQDVFTKPSLLYFGYTYCPDVCPLDTARNVEAVDVLDEKGIEVTPVFISIDPERDTPEAMSDFAEVLHDRMIGLTGTFEQVDAASKAYKTYYRKNGEGEDYLMDHSTFTYLVLPEFGFVEFFRRDLTPEALAESVACFVDAS